MDNTELEKQLRLIKDTATKCLQALSSLTTNETGGIISSQDSSVPRKSEIDFSMQPRAFFKRFSNEMSGPKVFALMVAYFTYKNRTETASLSEIQKEWSKMKSIIKYKFSTTFAVRARENDWIMSPKSGLYSLRPEWKKIFE